MTKKVGTDDGNAESQEKLKKIHAMGKVVEVRPYARRHTRWYFKDVHQQLYRKITSHLKFRNRRQGGFNQ
jgi:hypothetical protein